MELSSPLVDTTYYYFVSDSGILSKPKELIHQDLYYSYARGQTAVLACNVQSVPPPAFRYVLLIGLSKFKLTSNGRRKGFFSEMSTLPNDDEGEISNPFSPYHCTFVCMPNQCCDTTRRTFWTLSPSRRILELQICYVYIVNM